MLPVRPLPADDLAHVLAHTRELWADARGGDIFITGGTGFFGVWLLETFANANDRLGLGMRATVLTRSPEAFAAKAPHLATRPDLRFVAGDIRDFAFPPGRFALLIPAATDVAASGAGEDASFTISAIVDGTRRVLDFAAQAGARRLLLTSSGAVYGRQPVDLSHVPEDYAGAPDPLSPGAAYGEGKRVAEHLCFMHARLHGYELAVARCFAFVGPHLPLDAHFAMGNFLRDVYAGRPIQIVGDGSPVRSYLHAADLAVWLWTMLFRAPSGRAYNVGSDHAVDLLATAQAVAAASPQNPPVFVARQADPSKAPPRYVPSIHRAEAELGLCVRIPLQDAIARTLAWLSPLSNTNLQ